MRPFLLCLVGLMVASSSPAFAQMKLLTKPANANETRYFTSIDGLMSSGERFPWRMQSRRLSTAGVHLQTNAHPFIRRQHAGYPHIKRDTLQPEQK